MESRTPRQTRALVGTVASLAAALLLLVGILGLAASSPGLGVKNWLVVLLGVNAGLPGVSFDALRIFNPLDIAILVFTAIAFAGFWPGPVKPHRAWMVVAIALPMAGVAVLLATGLWGRSGLMSAAIVLSCLLLGTRRSLAVLGITANTLLLVGDFGTTGSRSLVMAIMVGAAYCLLLVWYVWLASTLWSMARRPAEHRTSVST